MSDPMGYINAWVGMLENPLTFLQPAEWLSQMEDSKVPAGFEPTVKSGKWFKVINSNHLVLEGTNYTYQQNDYTWNIIQR